MATMAEVFNRFADAYQKHHILSFEQGKLIHDIIEVEDVTQQWAGGRIDIRGEGLGIYGDEMGLPIMRGDSYRQFSDWLDTFKTDDVWTLAQLVELYERANPKIIWADDVFGDMEKNK